MASLPAAAAIAQVQTVVDELDDVRRLIARIGCLNRCITQDEAAEELDEDVNVAAATVSELHVKSDSEPSEVRHECLL